MKYNAFLSYSHAADNALAPALQSALHRFARPWNRMRALRVFRDKTSLAASPELWPAIVAALSDADWFLLMASPAAAQSRWVQREIEWWLENRSPQKMLVLLTEGELVWDEAARDFDWQRTDGLPSLLRGRFASEPLWIDLRWAQAGETMNLRHGAFRLAVLDIATPLHGKSKDELDGEDVRQFARTRRLTAGAVTALVLLTISSIGAAIFAVRQRDEALRQSTTAQAGRLAAQADLLRERGGRVDDSVMLAAEALRLLDSIGTRSLEVDLSLRRALALLPGTLGGFEVGADNELQIAADGRHATLHALGDQVSVRHLPGGELRGCQREDIAKQLADKGLPASILIQGASASGGHCATVALNSAEKRVIDIWSAAPLARVASLQHVGAVHVRLALSDDGEFLAITDRAQSGETSSGAFRVWSRSRQADLLRQTGAEFIGFGPDRLFVASNGVWRLPATPQGAASQLLVWARVPYFQAFSRSGRHIATRKDHESDVEVWDLKDLGSAQPARPIRSASAPSGKLLALGDDARSIVLDATSADTKATLLWSLEPGSERARLPVEPIVAAFGEREAIVLADEPDTPHSRRILVLGMQSVGAASARVDSRSGESVLWLGFGGPHLHRLVAAGEAIRIDAWAWASATPATKFSVDRPTAWSISADGQRFAIGRAGGVVVGAVDGSAATREFATTQAQSVLALSARGDVLAAATTGGLQAWKLDSAERWTSAPLRGPLLSLRVSDDGLYAIAVVRAAGEAKRAGHPYELLRWRLAGAPEPLTVALGHHLTPPDLACLVSSDGISLLAGAQRLDIAAAAASAPGRIWFSASAAACTAIAGGGLEASIEGEHLLITDAKRGQPIARLEHGAKVQLAALSADGRHAATLDEGGSVRVWALAPTDLIAQACARKPRALNAEAWARYMPAATGDACGRAREGDAAAR
jgi:hypothetical protein